MRLAHPSLILVVAIALAPRQKPWCSVFPPSTHCSLKGSAVWDPGHHTGVAVTDMNQGTVSLGTSEVQNGPKKHFSIDLIASSTGSAVDWTVPGAPPTPPSPPKSESSDSTIKKKNVFSATIVIGPDGTVNGIVRPLQIDPFSMPVNQDGLPLPEAKGPSEMVLAFLPLCGLSSGAPQSARANFNIKDNSGTLTLRGNYRLVESAAGSQSVLIEADLGGDKKLHATGHIKATYTFSGTNRDLTHGEIEATRLRGTPEPNLDLTFDLAKT